MDETFLNFAEQFLATRHYPRICNIRFVILFFFFILFDFDFFLSFFFVCKKINSLWFLLLCAHSFAQSWRSFGQRNEIQETVSLVWKTSSNFFFFFFFCSCFKSWINSGQYIARNPFIHLRHRIKLEIFV